MSSQGDPASRRAFLAGVGIAVGGVMTAGSFGGERSSTAGSTTADGIDLSTDSPSFQYDRGNTGRIDAPGPSGHPSVQWTIETKNTAASRHVPAVVDGVAYAASSRGTLQAFDYQAGEHLWTADRGKSWAPERSSDRYTHTPTVVEGRVYHSTPTHVVAHTVDGQFLWAAGWDRNELPPGNPPIATAPIVAGGRVVVSLDDGVYGIDTDTGARAWKTSTHYRNPGAPAAADGTVYLSREDGYVYALDVATGDRVWGRYFGPSVLARSTNYGSVQVSTPTVDDGTVFVAVGHRQERSSTVFALDAADGGTRWSAGMDRSIAGELADVSVAVTDDLVFAMTTPPTLYAFDRADGTRRWAVRERGRYGFAPVVAGDTVYSGTAGRSVVARDFDGDERWRFDVGEGGVVLPPVLVLDEYVIVGTIGDPTALIALG